MAINIALIFEKHLPELVCFYSGRSDLGMNVTYLGAGAQLGKRNLCLTWAKVLYPCFEFGNRVPCFKQEDKVEAFG